MKIQQSLLDWGSVDFEWHLRYDLGLEHIGGQAVKNAMLDSITDGWVWFLDDDTLAHPSLYSAVERIADSGLASAVVVSQDRHDGRILEAAPENVAVNEIDIGQAVMHRDLIGRKRIPETYAGDGEFLEAVLDGGAVYLNEILSFHNALERPIRR